MNCKKNAELIPISSVCSGIFSIPHRTADNAERASLASWEKAEMFSPELHTETLRSSSFLSFSLGYSYFTSVCTQFPVRLVPVVCCVHNCICDTGNVLSFKMHKDIYLYSFFTEIVENKNSWVTIPISMPSFSRLPIRSLGQAMCDISVRDLWRSLLPDVWWLICLWWAACGLPSGLSQKSGAERLLFIPGTSIS